MGFRGCEDQEEADQRIMHVHEQMGVRGGGVGVRNNAGGCGSRSVAARSTHVHKQVGVEAEVWGAGTRGSGREE